MKTAYKLFAYSFSIVIFLSFLISCHQRIELEHDYSDFRRVIGPEGGTINFYEYNPSDSLMDILVSMEFNSNAIDSFIVFNMYEFDDDAVYFDMVNLGIEYYTEFLYFVPFSETKGYNEENTNLEQHDSIDFNSPVTVTYNISYYDVPEDAELYRIYIPRKDNWSDNVWVEWNTQGYPIGYDELDLTYLINGRWTEYSFWGSADLSTDNWELLPYPYNYNPTDSTVRFDIYNTDYMYVMANEY